MTTHRFDAALPDLTARANACRARIAAFVAERGDPDDLGAMDLVDDADYALRSLARAVNERDLEEAVRSLAYCEAVVGV